MEASLPSVDVIMEFLSCGFQVMIVAARERDLGPEYLGRLLNPDMIAEFDSRGVDPAGEAGEYRTIVIDGPCFSRPLKLQKGEVVSRSGYSVP